MSELTTRKAGRNLIRTMAIVLVIVLVYAIAVTRTDISLVKPLDPERQGNFMRVLRLLADPDLITRDDTTGNLVLSETTKLTYFAIIETIFMALMASTIGTILAIPISFLAARNLMTPITAPLAALMSALLAAGAGGAAGFLIARWLSMLAETATGNLLVGLVVFVAAAVAVWLVMKLGRSLLHQQEATGSATYIATLRLLLALMLLTFAIAVLAQISVEAGLWLKQNLGPFGFLGNFIYVLADALYLFMPAVVALLAALVAASYGSRYGQEAVLSWSHGPARLLTAVLTVAGVFVLVYAIGSALNWLYQFDNPQNWTLIPALIGAALAGLGSLFISPKRPFAIGYVTYTLMRAILNMLRAIEPLIMAIVFVIWVGLGPFAGIMALTLHSIAALGKLFSEQVEGIDDGPIEAILATGASRLQMVVYAVVPQIVPPFTAFALYRWDINVRMSTIIGFVGGGGIGLLLSQNIRLLLYRQVSVMMLAIAIVVATLDYISSWFRNRII
jgi:phosphonate ABC transporter permease subunit PhnE